MDKARSKVFRPNPSPKMLTGGDGVGSIGCLGDWWIA